MDESAIIEGMARNDPRAFRELVERYKKKVYFLALDMAGNPVDAGSGSLRQLNSQGSA